MPSRSKPQARLMAAVAHGWKKPGGGGPPVSVAKEFNQADAKTGILRRGYARGGLSKIKDFLAETAEARTKRQALEQKAARAPLPGIFSTLSELVNAAPPSGLDAEGWRAHLAQPLQRGPYTFHVQPDEMADVRLEDLLGAPDRPQLGLKIPRKEVKAWIDANRPRLSTAHTYAGDMYSPGYGAADGEYARATADVVRAAPPDKSNAFRNSSRAASGISSSDHNADAAMVYTSHVPAGRVNLVTDISSPRHERAGYLETNPTEEALQQLKQATAGLNLRPAQFDSVKTSLGLDGAIVSPDQERDLSEHPMLRKAPVGYSPHAAFSEKAKKWFSDEIAAGRDPNRGDYASYKNVFSSETGTPIPNPNAAESSMPFRGDMQRALLGLRMRLLKAAHNDGTDAIALANHRDVDAHSHYEQWARKQMMEQTAPEALRKMADQYQLPVHQDIPVGQFPEADKPDYSHPPEPYRYLYQDIMGREVPPDVTFPQYLEDMDLHFGGGRFSAASEAEQKAALTNQMAKSMQRRYLTLTDVNRRDRYATSPELKASLSPYSEDMVDIIRRARHHYMEDTLPHPEMLQKMTAMDQILRAAEAQHQAEINAAGDNQPVRRMGVSLTPEDREKIKAYGVPLYSLLGAGVLAQPDDADASPGYAKGGIAKLTDLLRESAEETSARRQLEMLRARTTIPGAFSTLAEAIDSAPMGKATGRDWLNYLKPGRTIMRGGVSFPLKKDEIDFAGLPTLLNAVGDETIDRERLAKAVTENRPSLHFHEQGQNLPTGGQYSQYSPDWAKKRERNTQYREHLVSVADNNDLIAAAQRHNGHFHSIPSALAWMRGNDMPEGYIYHEIQSDIGGKYGDRFAYPDMSRFADLAEFAKQAPNPGGLPVAINALGGGNGYAKQLRPGEPVPQGYMARTRNKVPREAVQYPDDHYIDERVPFLDMQEGYTPLMLRVQMQRLADLGKNYLAFPSLRDASFSTGAGGLENMDAGRRAGLMGAYGIVPSTGEPLGKVDLRTFLPMTDPKTGKRIDVPNVITAGKRLANQYGLTFTPETQVSGTPADELLPQRARNHLPTVYHGVPSVEGSPTPFISYLKKLGDDAGLSFANTDDPETLRRVADLSVGGASRVLAHYRDLYNDQSIDEGTRRAFLSKLLEADQHANNLLQAPATEIHAPFRSLVGKISEMDTMAAQLNGADMQRHNLPPINRPAIILKPEDIERLRKIGIPLFSTLLGGAALDQGSDQPQDDQATGFAEGGSVRPGLLRRAVTAAKPLWMARDENGNLKSAASYLAPGSGAPSETGLADTLLGTPSDLHLLLQAIEQRLSGGRQIDAPKDELGIQSAIDWLRNQSQRYSDKGSKLREEVMAADRVPAAEGWQENLADTVGEMGGSFPVPGSLSPKLAKRGLGILEYISPTIVAKPGNYVHGTVGGTILKEALPRLMGQSGTAALADNSSEPYLLDGPPRTFGYQ